MKRLAAVLIALIAVVAIPAAAESAAPLHLSGPPPSASPILHVTKFRANGTYDVQTWSDPARGEARTLAYDIRGKLDIESVTSLRGHRLRTDTFEYQSKEWRTASFSLPATYNYTFTESQFFPDQLRKDVKTHILSVVGPEPLDGKRMLHLRGQLGTTYDDLWVVPGTYRVAEDVEGEDVYGATVTSKILFDWLPPTRANRAKTTLKARAGFRHLKP